MVLRTHKVKNLSLFFFFFFFQRVGVAGCKHKPCAVIPTLSVIAEHTDYLLFTISINLANLKLKMVGGTGLNPRKKY
jgi:hypothetical protein